MSLNSTRHPARLGAAYSLIVGKMKFILIALVALAPVGCRKTDATIDAQNKRPAVHSPTALVAIIADPERFDKKSVSISGFYRHGFEVSGIFPSRDMSFSEANGLWLECETDAVIEPPPADSIWKSGKPLWLNVDGIIDANSHGHLGAWTGSIRATRIKADPIEWLDDRTK